MNKLSIKSMGKARLRINPKLFVIDWDETITKDDTIKLVAEAAYSAKPGYQPPFDHFTNTYMNAFTRYSDQFKERYGARDSIEKEVNFQTGLQSVEMSSINELMRLKLFEGLTFQQFEHQANKVVIKDHFVDFLSKCRELRVPVIILSVNWTKIIMKTVFNSLGFQEDENLKFVVNELEFKNGLSTGNFSDSVSIRTGIDKVNILEDLVKQYGRTCYIGDSSTDLLSLIKSDIGIAIENSTVLKSVGNLNIPTRNLLDTDELHKEEIYIGNWSDICCLL